MILSALLALTIPLSGTWKFCRDTSADMWCAANPAHPTVGWADVEVPHESSSFFDISPLRD